MIKVEKWFMLWAIYTSIAMMICIVTIPLSIINLINIKKTEKKEIDIKELKKNAYFSSDWTLILASKFAFKKTIKTLKFECFYGFSPFMY